MRVARKTLNPLTQKKPMSFLSWLFKKPSLSSPPVDDGYEHKILRTQTLEQMELLWRFHMYRWEVEEPVDVVRNAFECRIKRKKPTRP